MSNEGTLADGEAKDTATAAGAPSAQNLASALVKYAKAARLSAEAAKLMVEAAEEMAQVASNPVTAPSVAITEVDVARAKRALRRLGLRTR